MHATSIGDSASDNGTTQSYQGWILIEALNSELLSLENNLFSRQNTVHWGSISSLWLHLESHFVLYDTYFASIDL